MDEIHYYHKTRLYHFHRQITSSDLDIYKTRLLGILKSAHSALDKHKKQYQDSYKQYYDKNKKTVEYTIGETVRVHFPIAEQEKIVFYL